MRYWLLILLALLCALPANAQSSAYGVRAGISPTVYFPDSKSRSSVELIEAEQSTSIGFAVGIDGFLDMGSNMAIGAQALYLVRAYSFEYYNGFFDAASTRRGSRQSHYLELPLSLRYTFTNVRFRPYIFSGFSLGLFLSGNEKIVYQDVLGSVEENSKFERDDNLAVFMGLGAQYDIGSATSVILDLTYSGDISTRPFDHPAPMSVLRVMAGITFW